MICLTGGERTRDALAARLAAHPDIPLQEVRLDLLEHIDDGVLDLLTSPGIIVTCRPAREGGGFVGDERQRLDLLRRALDRGPGYLDLEGTVSAESRRRLFEQRRATRLVLSWHFFGPTDPEQLRRTLLEAPAEADLLKLAVAVEDTAELLPLLRLSREVERRTVLIGMGLAGLASRALYPRFGSPWTYVVADGAKPVAPGQLALGQARSWRVERAAELRPVGLLGGPGVTASPGPRVYNARFADRDLPHLYLPLITTRAAETLQLCQELGFAGLGVTMPLKREIAALLPPARLHGAAGALEAVNTLVCEAAGWSGHNTDEEAIAVLLADEAGRPALVLGAGGAALAAGHALRRLGCAVAVSARHGERAAELAARVQAEVVPWERRGAQPFQLLVNATPLGSDGASDPMPDGVSWQGRVVLDAVIAPHPTPLVRRAREGGARVIAGREWWLVQGQRQMQLITGQPFAVEELRGALIHEPALPASAAVTLQAPGSKSQTQRALILAALTPGRSTLLHPLECDDSQVLRRALGQLGVQIAERGQRWDVVGGELRAAPGPLWCGEAGTTSRFLAPLCLVLPGELQLDGSPRLRERPLAPLLDALERLGAQVHCDERPGALPVRLQLHGRPAAGTWIDVAQSSQFLSGLLLVAPRLPGGLTLESRGDVVSRPYVGLTLAALRCFGAEVIEQPEGFRVPPARLHPCELAVEGDWSAAAFLLAGAHLAGREVRVANLLFDSMQGDRVIVDQLRELRRPRPHSFDLGHCPDLIAPLAAAAVTADHPVAITGVAHARIKESDRVAVLVRGLREAGALVDEQPNGLTLRPGGTLRPAELDPAGDHRMAMAFGLLSLLEPGITVKDPGCVSKSFPGFWAELERLR